MTVGLDLDYGIPILKYTIDESSSGIERRSCYRGKPYLLGANKYTYVGILKGL
jgi:hypothetical protein